MIDSSTKLTTCRPDRLPQAPIEIPYRNDAAGRGAYYDNNTLRSCTRHQSVVSVPEGYSTEELLEFNKDLRWSRRLEIDVANRLDPFPSTVIEPQKITNTPPEARGLLVITGVSSKIKDPAFHTARIAHEKQVLRHAILSGRPVLGICAGSWKLADAHAAACSLDPNATATYINAKDHDQGCSTSFDESGRVVNNIQVHRLHIQPRSMLGQMVQHKLQNTEPMTVNSIHWLALKPADMPETLVINATALPDSSLAPRGLATNEPIHPLENTVEGFETKFGSPMIGVQWHPEVYNPDDEDKFNPLAQREILYQMALAGDAWNAKRQTMSQLLKEIPRFESHDLS